MTRPNLLAFCAVALLLFGCATGSHIVTGTIRPAISPEAVKVYGAAPTNAEVIAIVTASFRDEGQAATDACIKELKRQAARLGGNGVVIGGLGAAPGPTTAGSGAGVTTGGGVTTTTGGLFHPPSTVIQGTAVFVPAQ